MPNTLALIALMALKVQTMLMVTASADDVVTLVCIIKSIRQLGCEPFLCQLSQIRKEGGKTIGFSQSTKVGSTRGQSNLRCSFTRVCSVGKGI
jgi:hypothetical protein